VRRLLSSIAVLVCCGLASTFGSTAAAAATTSDAPLVTYTAVNGAIPQSLTGVPGDPAKGKAVVLDRKLGNCLACHHMPLAAPFQGNLGPDLAGVGSRLSAGQLRLRIADPKLINPATIMPGYYQVAGLHDVAKKFVGKPILTAQEVEDVVAYLLSLK